MPNEYDVRPVGTLLYFLPVATRVPLKFGAEVMSTITCARVQMAVIDAGGRQAVGWGETPLSVQWVWPADLSYNVRHRALQEFCLQLADAWAKFPVSGHPMEVGQAFQETVLPQILADHNHKRQGQEPLPWLAALVCCAAFDIALHDAYGVLHDRPIYELYGPPYMNADLTAYLTPATGPAVDFAGKYPQDFLVSPPPELPAWHLVGGLDPLEPAQLTGVEPDDGYPVLLRDWIKRDGLRCLKVKLRGNDAAWDYNRLFAVGRIAQECGVDWMTADFNCMVTDPLYVTEILDRLQGESPRIFGMILYVEQPFPYELETHRIDVHSVSARKPLFMDESAHDWRLVKLGRELGWTGVALKTCKTQTGALLTMCWAKAHGMTLMVQDLTNPMLAQVPHVQLAAHAGTIMGVESNAVQFYPDASLAEEQVHPGLFRRRAGNLSLASLHGPGFGYRIAEIKRVLPPPAVVCRGGGAG